MRLAPILLLLATPALAIDPAPPAGAEIREGWDWSLPADVQPAPYSGFITWGNTRFDPAITVRGVMLTWKQLNPAPGVYSWDLARAELERNRALGMRTGLHLKGVERGAVPDWVVEKFRPVILDAPPLQEDQPWRLQIVPPWQPPVDDAFHDFLREFAKTGIAQSQDVVYGYLHGISASRGEEMFIRKIDLDLWQRTTGLTAPRFADWLRRRIDAMCEVFRGVEHKLAVMWDGPLGPTPEFRDATADLHGRAIARGAGIRGGGIDFMFSLMDAPAWGSSIDPRGYLIVDDEHPTIREPRFRGDENEEYGKYWEWRFGPVDGYPYRHRICTLRGLQMRQNFQMISLETLRLDPPLNEYARVTQGYRRHNSPDAWVYLRETYRGPRPIKNIERWILQRDLPGHTTIPAERVDRFPMPSERARGADSAHDFDARRTDRANAQNGILFAIDRVFWPSPAPATLKVTYIDRAPTRWHVAYTDGNGKRLATAAVANIGDGKRKTATFAIPSLAARGRFPEVPQADREPARGGDMPSPTVANGDVALQRIPASALSGNVPMDFQIATDGPGDVTLSMVRIVKIRGGAPRSP